MKKYKKIDGITIQAMVTKDYEEKIINKSIEYGMSYSDMLLSAIDEQLLNDNIISYNFNSQRNKKISIKVTKKYKGRIDNYCNKYNITKTDFIISALENYIDRRNIINKNKK